MGAVVHRWRHAVRHEGRLTLTWWHAAVLLLLIPLTAPQVTISIRMDDRTLLLMARVGVPLLAVVLVPGLVLRDVAVGSAELIATTRTGLKRVWLVRFLVTFLWLAGVLLILTGPLVARVQTRFSPTATVAASLLDVIRRT